MKVKDRAFGLKLIAAVKREPCLYAYFYGNRESSTIGSHTRKAAWQRVANELEMSVPDVKAKWNTMRDRYRTLRGKNQGQEWFYFQPMSFMEQFVKPGRNRYAGMMCKMEPIPCIVLCPLKLPGFPTHKFLFRHTHVCQPSCLPGS